MNLIEQEPRPNSEDTRLIPLTQGKYTVVDADDFETLSKHRWFAVWDKESKTFYAHTNIPRQGGGYTLISMHRMLLGREAPIVDHWDHDGLNNRRRNLRNVSHVQSCQNRRLRADNK